MANSGTDWERLINMTDEEAYQNAFSDPDNPPLLDIRKTAVVRARDVPGDTLVEKYRNLRQGKYKELVAIPCDADVLAWFKAKGDSYPSLMNEALRAFMEAGVPDKA